MLHRHAKAERAHLPGRADLGLQGPEHGARTHVVAGVKRLEGGKIVAARAKVHARKVGAVMHAEVLKGDEQPEVEGVPEAKLGGHAPVEPAYDRLPVAALGRGREPEQDLRAKVLKQPPVGGASAW